MHEYESAVIVPDVQDDMDLFVSGPFQPCRIVSCSLKLYEH